MFFAYLIIFLASAFALYWAGSRLVNSMSGLAKFLGWREFAVAFLVMSFATSLPNLFVGIGSALTGIPELSLGDVLGGNVVNLTLSVGLAVLFTKKGIKAESKMVQSSALFTFGIVMLPLFLMLDGGLQRIDGFILLLTYFLYSGWLFASKRRFTKVYSHNLHKKEIRSLGGFLNTFFQAAFCVAILLGASIGMVQSAKGFSLLAGVPIAFIGILVLGFGNTMPETYFSICAARKGDGWMVLGNLMGSVIVCTTFVLGIVILIAPISSFNIASLAIARAFLLASAFIFWIIVRSDHRIKRAEGAILIFLYLAFVLGEIWILG